MNTTGKKKFENDFCIYEDMLINKLNLKLSSDIDILLTQQTSNRKFEKNFFFYDVIFENI